MVHPRQVRMLGGTKWHLEDTGLTKSDALALKRHLIHTEGKRARAVHDGRGYQVWWAK